MPELLLELCSEEIPPRMQARGAADLAARMGERLRDAGLAIETHRFFAGPRRLTYVAQGLADRTPDLIQERKGPRTDAPQKAIEGFLRSAGLASVEDAQVQEGKGGAFYVARTTKPGRPTAELIAEIVPQVVTAFSWPKSMRWGGEANDLRWARPLRSVLCLFAGETVAFEIENGDRPIVSGGNAYGHRFLAPRAIEVTDFADYEERLRAARVILDAREREGMIAEGAGRLAADAGLALVEDPGLVSENAGLTEWPVPKLGRFDEKFLSVPDEVLTAAMRGHQKYFSVRDPGTGRLAPRFVCVANIDPEDERAMMVGYERVLAARLSDAWFLYRQDLKTPLAEHAERLADVTFFKGLGTIADRTGRVAALARQIAPLVGADPDLAEEAARLSKADLVTEMVGEFPELQGVMGRYYYLEQTGGEADAEHHAVADAIRDHYRPAGQNDEVPTAPVTVAVALADRLVTLAMFWSIGETPTGSKDPFALRRMALGVIQILLSNDIRLDLRAFFADLPLLAQGRGEAAADLTAFLQDRLAGVLRDREYRHDHIAAVSSAETLDVVLRVRRLDALRDLLATDDGRDLTAAYKRAKNILNAEEKKTGALVVTEPEERLFAQGEERALYGAIAAARAEVDRALDNEDFSGAMRTLSALRGPIDVFFEAVTVNADEPAVRNNRLALLTRFTKACDAVADFSALEG